MPNHVKNRLIIEVPKGGMSIGSLISRFSTDKSHIDFDKIIPMPKSLRITSGSLGNIGYDYLKNHNVHNYLCLSDENKEEALKLGKQYVENEEKWGYTTWYEWSVDNWGTKWNAYGFEDIENFKTEETEGCIITFNTAWSPPLPIFQKLISNHPNAKFKLIFADEDAGSNVGVLYGENGNLLSTDFPPSHSFEAFDIYFELNPEEREFFVETEDGYEYKGFLSN